MKKHPLFWSTVLFTSLLLTNLYCTNDKGSTGSQPVNKPTATMRNSAGTVSDFTVASHAITPAVVHIKTQYSAAQASNSSPFDELFGERPSGVPVAASGSGIIITTDGYVVTNNHVVEDASAIEVVLPDRRSYAGRLIGRDPNTDLALLKISASNLPVAQLGNSDSVQVGEWVLAVGYPLSLNTTVTAGIISAKGRSIGIINSRASTEGAGAMGNTAVESFIQTDAAINPGNSGGALVNINGQLIGINTAIASQTGSYAGYGFAVPVNLAQKVWEDLKKFGVVKRAVLGVAFPAPAIEDQFLRQQGINPGAVHGVYITNVMPGSAAAAAGLKTGDIIQSIDGVTIASSSEFSERIARHRPGDKVQLSYLRNGKTNTLTVTLQEETRVTAQPNRSQGEIFNKLGASFAPLSDALKRRFGVRAGVVVTEVRPGGFFEQLGVIRGTILTLINGKSVGDPNEVGNALMAAQNGMIQMMGIAPDGSRVAFSFSLGT